MRTPKITFKNNKKTIMVNNGDEVEFFVNTLYNKDRFTICLNNGKFQEYNNVFKKTITDLGYNFIKVIVKDSFTNKTKQSNTIVVYSR